MRATRRWSIVRAILSRSTPNVDEPVSALHAALHKDHRQKAARATRPAWCVVDREGNLFSSTPSSGWLLNGAFIAGDTGVPLSNRMQVFDLDPIKSRTYWSGAKRPRTTLSPSIVTRDDIPYLAICTPGGDNQDQQILNVLLGMLVFDFELQEALEAPRINSQHPHLSFGTHESQPGVLQVEDRIDAQVLDALRERGHKLSVQGAYGISTGVVAVGVDPVNKTLRGGADVRRERYAFGW